MAMFDIEDSGKINLDDVHTSSETLVRGKRIASLDVKHATAGSKSLGDARGDVDSLSPKRTTRRIVEGVAIGLIVLLLGAIIMYFFPFLKSS